jgi:hypothetical protein
MLALSSSGAVLAAIRQAREVSLSAFRLRPAGPLFDALAAAAASGAAVRVRLAGPGFGAAGGSPGAGEAAAANQAAAAALRARGVEAALSGAGEPPLHMKALIADGTLFLDDRNWPGDGRDTILATSDPADIAAVRSALAGVASEGQPPSRAGVPSSGEPRPAPGPAEEAGALATAKGRALELEAGTIAGVPEDPAASGDRVECESESFGPGRICAALRRRAEAGAQVRLLVGAGKIGAGEVLALRGLAAAGAEIRFGERAEKLALAGGRGWVGSANATSASPATLDWGYTTGSPALLAALRDRFDEGWSAGHPFETSLGPGGAVHT